MCGVSRKCRLVSSPCWHNAGLCQLGLVSTIFIFGSQNGTTARHTAAFRLTPSCRIQTRYRKGPSNLHRFGQVSAQNVWRLAAFRHKNNLVRFGKWPVMFSDLSSSPRVPASHSFTCSRCLKLMATALLCKYISTVYAFPWRWRASGCNPKGPDETLISDELSVRLGRHVTWKDGTLYFTQLTN